VQKTNNSIAGFFGNILNIPEFTGPPPIFHSQHHNEFLQQQGRNSQETPRNTSQESPRTTNQSSEQFTANSQQHASPNATEDPFCWYQEDHIQEGIHNCQKSLRGPWLRSTSYGRKVNDKRDPRFNSNPMKSMSGGRFSPIPKAMLDLLAKMSLEEETLAGSKKHTGDNTTEQQQDNSGDNTTQRDTSGQANQGSINSQKQTVTTMAGLISRAGQQQ
jgi:hypothetical protein